MAPLVSLVAIPLGNPEDLSVRAARRLREARVIFCEDTRKLGELLKRASIETRARLVALPGAREREFDWARFASEGEGHGESWVLVSDAGTPIVNDPGLELTRFAREHGWPLEAVPGPCAPILAWQWGGGFGLPFHFAGFAPKAKRAGAKELEDFFAGLRGAGTFAYFDSKHQFETTLEHLEHAGHGARRMQVAREMTKPHEELREGSVSEVLVALREKLRSTDALGEMTFLLAGDAQARTHVGASLGDLARLRRAPTKEAARIAAKLTGEAVSDCYDAFIDKE